MSPLLPRAWIVAHRSVDLSAGFGEANLADRIAASKNDENALASMAARFSDGFGVETDLRNDPHGTICLSHDPPLIGRAPMLGEALALYVEARASGMLALNIKDAGLQPRLTPLIQQFGIQAYFTFDGPVPDMLADCAAGLRAFVRESDIEPWNAAQAEHPLPNYASATGVWMDNFSGRAWIDAAAVERHYSRGKDVALVSPELHPWGRCDTGALMLQFWTEWRDVLRRLRAAFPDRRMLVCTKLPTHAFAFFNALI